MMVEMNNELAYSDSDEEDHNVLELAISDTNSHVRSDQCRDQRAEAGV